MKRNYSAVLSLLLAGGICCTGCAKAGGEATAAQKLGGSFTTEMTMTMEDWTAAGTLSRLGDGAWSVSFAEPATLAGVVLDFSGGEVTASYKGLGFSVPQSAMPAKSVLSQMIQVVDELAQQEEITGKDVQVIAYPYSDYDQRVCTAAAKYYRFGYIDWPKNYYAQYEIGRTSVHRDITIEQFEALLH